MKIQNPLTPCVAFDHSLSSGQKRRAFDYSLSSGQKRTNLLCGNNHGSFRDGKKIMGTTCSGRGKPSKAIWWGVVVAT